MADRLDVAGRLAEGLPAVEHTQSYLRACQQVGYQHPDLADDPAQLRERYLSEDGLDLHALDADCAQLRAAGTVVTEALRLQRDQLAALTAAWTGPGADSAVAFLQRHCAAAGVLVADVRAAAQRCESLRDNLWYLVDAKVATAVAIDDRTLAQRPTWLAAAAAVSTGTAAQEIVEQQIRPYVDKDIRHDWLTAMQSTRAGITASYDMVTDRLAAAPRAYFEIPGDLAPVSGPLTPPQRPVALSAAPVRTATAPAVLPGLPIGPVSAPSTFGPAPAPAFAPAPAPADAAPLSALPTSATPNSSLAQPDWGAGWGGSGSSGGSGMSGGLGGGGDLGGLGGLAGRIVAAMSDLLGSSAGQADDDPLDADGKQELERPEQPEEPKKPESAGRVGDTTLAAPRPIGQPANAAGLPGAGPPAAGPVADAPPKPAAPPEPPPAGATPCEIAANELPQAGQ